MKEETRILTMLLLSTERVEVEVFGELCFSLERQVRAGEALEMVCDAPKGLAEEHDEVSKIL